MRIFVKKLAKVHMDSRLQLSSSAVETLEMMCDHLVERLTLRAGKVVDMNKSRTLNAKSVQGALGLELPPKLAQLCDEAGVAAVVKLTYDA